MTADAAAAARAILGERARLLARRPTAPADGETVAVVAFITGGESFAIETAFIREIVRLRHLSPLPRGPAAVRGVTTYRGEILPVLDVRVVLGHPAEGLADLIRILVLGRAGPEFGLLADEVAGAGSLPTRDLLALPAEISARAKRYLRAMTPDAMLVLDGAALLADPEFFASARSLDADPSNDELMGEGTDG